MANPNDRIKTEAVHDMSAWMAALVIALATFANLALLVYLMLGGIG